MNTQPGAIMRQADYTKYVEVGPSQKRGLFGHAQAATRSGQSRKNQHTLLESSFMTSMISQTWLE